MDENQKAEAAVQSMLKEDTFSAWLNIRLVDIKPGRSVIEMQVRADMLNGFGRCHGGISFSLADSALAFASNSHGRVAVSIESSMSYPEPVFEGDLLTAVAEEESLGHKIAVYRVTLTSNHQRKVGLFRGTVYRTSQSFPLPRPHTDPPEPMHLSERDA